MKKLYVLKIGSSLLTTQTGRLNIDYLNKIAKIIHKNLLQNGNQIIIVTSGAIATGVGLLNLKEKPKSIPEKQALASLGQVELINHYAKVFKKYKKMVAQILLTKSHIEDRKRYLNIKNTIFTLLKKGIIPIVNENDTVSVDEIKFGDNDTLSATISSKMGADELIILTDVDGVFTENPKKNPNAKLVKEIKINDIENLNIDFSGKTGTNRGTGGMETKLKASKIACLSGVPVFITNGANNKILNNLFIDYSIGTKFLPDTNSKYFNHKERWIVFGAKSKGKIIIDDGAKIAILEKGKSLLPAGVKEVSGSFEKGDIVEILNLDKKTIAKGIVEYSKIELEKYKGMKTKDIEKNKPVIHKNHLVIFSKV